jgi:hypothetical protein
MTAPQVLDYPILNDELKKKRTKGVLDVTSHRNKDIFIETDSEQFNSRNNSLECRKNKKKNCAKLIVDTIDTLTSLIPGVVPTNTANKENAIIPENNQYSIKTYNNNKNNLNINNIEELKNLNINDGFEYEKCEKIKIKIMPNNNNNNSNNNNQSYNTYYSAYKTNNQNDNNNNRIEEKRILLHKIKTKNNEINKTNVINDDYNFDKERDLHKQKRTNNISYSNSEMKYHNYPFVISMKKKDNSNDIYYKTIHKKHGTSNSFCNEILFKRNKQQKTRYKIVFI